MCEKETGGFGAGGGGNGNSGRDQAEGGKVYTTEFRPASAERVDQLAQKVAQLESAVYTNAAGNVRINAAPGPSNADYATPIEKPYHNRHEHEWLACGASGQGGNGGPSVSTKEWACYCGATKKEVVTEPRG